MSKTGDLIQLNPHPNMSVSEALEYCSRNSADYSDVIVIGFDAEDGSVVLRSSHISRADAAFMLLQALDEIRGK